MPQLRPHAPCACPTPFRSLLASSSAEDQPLEASTHFRAFEYVIVHRGTVSYNTVQYHTYTIHYSTLSDIIVSCRILSYLTLSYIVLHHIML